MPDQRTSENWRLEEGGQEADKWLLQESEQQVSDQWELEQQPAEPIDSWQPVEYVKEPRPAGAWILPAIITVALLVTLGYAGFRVIPPLLNGDLEPTSIPVVAVDPEEETPSLDAEETPDEAMVPVEVPTAAQEETAPPTPTVPEPTPTTSSLVGQEFATVDSPFGVNARFSPNTDAPIIRILENGERLFVFGQEGEWIEVFVADTPLTEGQAMSGTVGFAAAEFFTVSTEDISQQLRNEVLDYAGKVPDPTPEPTAAAVVPPVEDSAPVTDTGAANPSAPLLTVTINAVNGVNVRQDPRESDSNIIRLLENGTVLPATGRTADGEWIQVTLPDALSGWIAAEFLVPSADITTLPVLDGSETITTTVPVTVPATDGAPVAATDVVTSGVEPPPPYTSVVPGDSTPAIIVTVADGVNARTEPVLDADVEVVVPQGAVLVATGRSTDNQWVQVELPTGASAWIFRDTVTATPAVGALPAVGGPTPEPILVPTPTPGDAAAPPETTESEATTVTAEVVPFFLPVYSEPDNQSDTIARAPRGSDFVVIGQSAGGSWLQVTTTAGETGWVVAGNVSVTGDVAGVPVVD